jgi:hypothetical protein
MLLILFDCPWQDSSALDGSAGSSEILLFVKR